MDATCELRVQVLGKPFVLKGLRSSIYRDLKDRLDERGELAIKDLLQEYVKKASELEDLELRLKELESKIQDTLK